MNANGVIIFILSQIKRVLFLFMFVLLTIISVSSVSASSSGININNQDINTLYRGYKVAQNEEMTIDFSNTNYRDRACYKISVNSGMSLFVPTRTEAEWLEFYSWARRPNSGVTLTTCTVDTWSTGSCSQTCGNGIIQGAVCSGANCDVAANPNGNSCTLKSGCTGSWQQVGCSVTCGGGLTTPTCVGGPCDIDSKPAAQSCNTQACYTYAYQDCTCSGAFSFRKCLRSDGVEVQFMNCAAVAPSEPSFCIGSYSYNGTCTTACPVGTVANASKTCVAIASISGETCTLLSPLLWVGEYLHAIYQCPGHIFINRIDPNPCGGYPLRGFWQTIYGVPAGNTGLERRNPRCEQGYGSAVYPFQ